MFIRNEWYIDAWRDEVEPGKPQAEDSCHHFWSVANGFRQDDPQTTEMILSRDCRGCRNLRSSLT